MKKGIINIFDHISIIGISSKTILKTLNDFREKNIPEVEVRINSAGGSLFEGFSIFNQLRDFGNVTTIIDGIAASIASVIALAGDKILAYKNSYIFIHNPWSIAIGDTNDMNDSANDLSKFRDTLIDIYRAKTGLTVDELKEMCNKSSFLNADEAKAIGLIDDIIDNYRTEKFVAFHSTIFNEGKEIFEPANTDLSETNNNTDNDNVSDNNTNNDFIDIENDEEFASGSAVTQNVITFDDLLDSVLKLKESFGNLKTDITEHLNNSVQLKIDIAQFAAQLDEKIKSGNLLPSMKNTLLDIINFVTTDHDETKEIQTKNLMKKFDAFLNQFPNMLLLDNIAYGPSDNNSTEYSDDDNFNVDEVSLELHNKAFRMSKEKNIPYKDAILNLLTAASNR